MRTQRMGKSKNDREIEPCLMDLIPLEDEALEIVKIMAEGNKKYGPMNWAHDAGTSDGPDFEKKNLLSIFSHLKSAYLGDVIDPDGGGKHLAKVALRALFGLYYIKHRLPDTELIDITDLKGPKHLIKRANGTEVMDFPAEEKAFMNEEEIDEVLGLND